MSGYATNQALGATSPVSDVASKTNSLGNPYHVTQIFAPVMSGDFPATEGRNENPLNHKGMVAVIRPTGICVGVSGQGRRWAVQSFPSNRKFRWIFTAPIVSLAPPKELLAKSAVLWSVVR